MTGNWFPRIETARLVAFLIVVKAVLFAILLPPWQGPDEPTRMEPVVIISKARELIPPMTPDPDYQLKAIQSMRNHHAWDHYERQVPDLSVKTFNGANLPAGASSLYETPWVYLPAGLAARWMAARTVEGKLYSARFSMLIIHLLATLVVGWISGFVFRGADWKLPRVSVVLMYGLHPQLSFLAASVHPDNLGFLTSSLVIGLVLFAAHKNELGASSRLWKLTLSGALVLGGFSGYLIRKQLILIPFLVTSVPLLFWPQLHRRSRVEAISKSVLIAIVIAFAFAVVLYHHPEWVGWRLHGYPQLGGIDELTGVSFGSWMRYLSVIFVTFWLALGSLVSKFGFGWLTFLFCAFASVLFGWVMYSLRRRMTHVTLTGVNRRAMAILGIWMGWVWLSMLIAYGPHVQNAEGRYLLGALPAIVCVWVGGWLFAVPCKNLSASAIVWAAAILLLNAVTLFQYLIPSYYLSHL